MAKRGRKSAVALSVVSRADVSAIASVQRPDPPEALDVGARDVWLGVVGGLPADWFDEVLLPVLEQYCRHVVEGRRLSGLIVQAVEGSDLDIADYDQLLRMRERETRAMASLATKMRLTHQARRNDRGNKVVPSGSRPWEDA